MFFLELMEDVYVKITGIGIEMKWNTLRFATCAFDQSKLE